VEAEVERVRAVGVDEVVEVLERRRRKGSLGRM